MGASQSTDSRVDVVIHTGDSLNQSNHSNQTESLNQSNHSNQSSEDTSERDASMDWVWPLM
jgi:hypothetical protein